MTEALTHEQALELLPWLVNDTLDGAERQRLERHVSGCLLCHAELRSQRALRALVAEQPTVDCTAERGFDALLGRIDEGPATRRPERRGWTALLAAGAAAAAAAVGVALWIAGPEADDPGEYSVLAEPGADEALVDIVFAPGVSETQLRGLLREIGGTIVSGPSDIGRYTVRVPAGRDALLERLRADERVRFAGPAFIAEPAETSE